MVAAGAGLSLNLDTRRAAVEAALAARAGLSGVSPSLAVLFASPHHAERAEALLDAVHEAAGPETVIGCVAEAVVGGGREVEGDPAVSVWLVSFPGRVDTFRLEYLPDQEAFLGWAGHGAGRAHLVICDPFTFPTDALLRELDREASGTVFIGGMASGAAGPGDTRLFLDHSVADLYDAQMQHTIGGVSASGADPGRVRAIPIFRELSGDALAAVAEHLRLERFVEGQDVIRRGDPGDRLYVINRGSVDVLTGDDDSGRIRELSEGDVFGERAVLTGEPRNATVRAATPLETFSLSADDLRTLQERFPQLRDAIRATAAQREAAYRAAAAAAGVTR